MARTLTVSHEEKLTVNWLFAGFMLVAVGWLMLFSLTATADADASADLPVSVNSEIVINQE